jgi:hypothetical protein
MHFNASRSLNKPRFIKGYFESPTPKNTILAHFVKNQQRKDYDHFVETI